MAITTLDPTRHAYLKTLREYRRVRGKVLCVWAVVGYNNCDSVDVYAQPTEPPFRVRVTRSTRQHDLDRSMDYDGTVVYDPCWNIEPVEHDPRLAHLNQGSMWMCGTSYYADGRTDPTDYEVE